MIYTFYSFKGGVGRSMALANIAELFYQVGLRVLIVDWDLEAPGLERFFFEDVREIMDKPGVIDLLYDYKRRISKKLSVKKGEELPFENPYNYITDIYPNSQNGGKIYLLTAGKRSEEHYANYADLVINFDWSDFYENWDGELYFEWLRQQFESIADVILIDSRTGITEMGGVCTYQFADIVVMFCAPNTQNLEGIYEMAESLKREEVLKVRNNRPIDLLIVPSRVEDRSMRLRLVDDLCHNRYRFTLIYP
jgi:cellulose biosynthesis protein BcsQ